MQTVQKPTWNQQQLYNLQQFYRCHIIQTYFDDRLCRWCAMRLVRWLVKFSHPIVQSHMTFLMRMWNLFGKCVSIVVYMHFSFLSDKKFILLSFFMCIFRIYAHLGVSIQRFFMRYSKMRIKIDGWKHRYSEQVVMWWQHSGSHEGRPTPWRINCCMNACSQGQ